MLAACSKTEPSVSGPAASAGGTTQVPRTALSSAATLRFANWSLYMDGIDESGARIPGDKSTLPLFEKATGQKVDYRQDVNDNAEFFEKVNPSLEAGKDCGYDLMVLTDYMVAKMIGLGYLLELDRSAIPNIKNLDPDLKQTFDPGNKFSLPWVSGWVGIAYDRKKVGKEIDSTSALFDPEYKGKVTLFSDMRDGLGMILLSGGSSPATAKKQDVDKAAATVGAAAATGQFARFTGNDYKDDLLKGEVIMSQAYSGDVAQLQETNPDLAFVVPKEGSSRFIDNLVIAKTAADAKGAHQFMDFVYDPVNMARIIATLQYPTFVKGYLKELQAIAPDIASSPLVDVPKDVSDRLATWRPLKAQEEIAYAAAYEVVTSANS